MNTHVNYKLAELLKLKKFNLKCQRYFRSNGSSLFNDKVIEQESEDWNSGSYPKDVVSGPTIAEVVMWIYDKYNIWISVDFDSKTWFEIIVFLDKDDRFVQNSHTTITEAYESAIEYVLNNFS